MKSDTNTEDIKLNLGADEEEEDEEEETEEEEEDEEDEQQQDEEEDKIIRQDNKIVAFNNIKPAQPSQSTVKVNQTSNRNQPIIESKIEKKNTGINNEEINEIFNKSLQKKKKKAENMTENHIKKSLLKQNDVEKSIFTKASERIINEMLYSKETKRKIDCYDILVNNLCFERLFDRQSQSNNEKINNFHSRNKEFTQKKKEKLEKKQKEKEENELNLQKYFIKPYSDKRSKEEYVNDMLKKEKERENNLKLLIQKEEIKLKNQLKTKPEIDENSKRIFEAKKVVLEEKRPVYERLFSQRMKKIHKSNLIGSNHRNNSLIMTKDEIFQSSIRLYTSSMTVKDKERSERLKSKSKEKQSEDEEKVKSLDKSERLLLKNLKESFLEALYTENNSQSLKEQAYQSILKQLGFYESSLDSSLVNSLWEEVKSQGLSYKNNNFKSDSNEKQVLHEENEDNDKEEDEENQVCIYRLFMFLSIIMNIHKNSTDFQYEIHDLYRKINENNPENQDFLRKFYEKDNKSKNQNLIRKYSLLRHNRLNHILNERNVKKKRILPSSSDENEDEAKKNKGNHIKINNKNNRKAQILRKERIISQIKVDIDEKERKECTFQPNLFKNKINFPLEDENTFNKLYDDYEVRNTRLLELRQKKQDEDERENKEKCPFSPEIHSKTYEITSIFNKNNEFYEDSLVKTSIKRYEKARIHRKVNEIQKRKGVTNLNSISDLEEQLEDKYIRSFSFANEVRFYKNTTEIHSTFQLNRMKSLNTKGFSSHFNHILNRNIDKETKERTISQISKNENENENDDENVIGSKEIIMNDGKNEEK